MRGDPVRRVMAAALAFSVGAVSCSGANAVQRRATPPGAIGSTGTPRPAAAAPLDVPVLLVHGFASVGSVGYRCPDYWGALTRALARWGWRGPVLTVRYESGDHDCDASIGAGGPNTPIETIGQQLAWYVFRTYSSRGRTVDLVGHSMGGLVIRSALAGVQAAAAGWPPYLFVRRVVTIATPHGGAPLAHLCRADVQCVEMEPGSAFLRALTEDPQGSGGTTWTLIGSESDELVPGASAVDMAASRRVIYSSPPYRHSSILDDGSRRLDAAWRELRGTRWTRRVHEPRSLCEVYLALAAL